MCDPKTRCFIFCLTMVFCFDTICSKDEESKRLIMDAEPNLDIGGEIGQLRTQLMDQQKLIQAMQTDLEIQKNITKHLERDNKNLLAKSNEAGSMYVRWGRNVCPQTASLVYKGYTAGKHYSQKGSGTNNLCLPEQPTWSNYNEGSTGSKAYIYGAEIDTYDSEHIFNYPVDNQDLPCAVCMTNKSRSLMIPARNNCYGDWTMEYHGYLMAGYHDYQAYEFICVDENPEFVAHGARNDDQHVLYLVEGLCGSLPCPPYVDGRELACVVCSV